MFEDFKHSIGDFYRSQSADLLHKQLSISQAILQERTGRLNQFLSGGMVRVDEESIRFLDMKRAALKTETVDKTVTRGGRKVRKRTKRGKIKQNYAPIYNKYVYGYLKSAVYRRLRSTLPSFMIREFTVKTQR